MIDLSNAKEFFRYLYSSSVCIEKLDTIVKILETIKVSFN